jgi:hypothetical protein
LVLSFTKEHSSFFLVFLVSCCGLLSSCGDLPHPFAGNPGAMALQLSRPPPPRLLVPPPPNGLLPQSDAAVWAHAMADALVAEEIPAYAEPAHKGEWMLRMTADLRGIQVTPHYSLIDPRGGDRGDVLGSAVPAAAWAQADPAVLRQSAGQAAPRVLALLRAVDAGIKQSDPNSLYNRPARIYFTGVTGAPGDGDMALTRFMRLKIPDTGDLLVDQGPGADFILRGTVKVTAEPGNQQQVEIHWLVSDLSGRLAGDVAQGHDVPAGTLDHYWGDIAAVITEEAAGGVHEVITNFSGRRRVRPPAAGAGKTS